MNISLSYVSGFTVGVVIAVVIALALRKSMGKGKEKAHYDERQQIARGRAFMWAFFSLLCYVALLGIASMKVSAVQENIFVFLMIGVCLSCGIFGIYSVWNDAYVQVGQNPRRYMILMAAIGVLNVVSAAFPIAGHLSHGEMLPMSALVNLVLGVLMFAMSFVLFLKRRAECMDEEER